MNQILDFVNLLYLLKPVNDNHSLWSEIQAQDKVLTIS